MADKITFVIVGLLMSLMLSVIVGSFVTMTPEEKQEILDSVSSRVAEKEAANGNNRDINTDSFASSSARDGNSNSSDLELSVPDDWKTAPGNSSTDKYPWEDDRNIPDLDWHLDEEPYDLKGDGDTGERGGTWEIPEFDMEMKPPITGEDANIPPMPGDGLLHNDDSDWKPDF